MVFNIVSKNYRWREFFKQKKVIGKNVQILFFHRFQSVLVCHQSINFMSHKNQILPIKLKICAGSQCRIQKTELNYGSAMGQWLRFRLVVQGIRVQTPIFLRSSLGPALNIKDDPRPTARNSTTGPAWKPYRCINGRGARAAGQY